MKHDIEARIFACQRGRGRSRRTDECYRKTLLHCVCNETGCEITACDDGQTQTAEPSQATQHAAVTKHPPRALVYRLHDSSILEQSDHVVYVRCDHIFEACPGLSQNIANYPFNRSGIKTTSEIINALSTRQDDASCVALDIPSL